MFTLILNLGAQEGNSYFKTSSISVHSFFHLRGKTIRVVNQKQEESTSNSFGKDDLVKEKLQNHGLLNLKFTLKNIPS